jgi:hypothetical protein
MKSTMSNVLVAALALAVVGCGKAGDIPSAGTSVPSAETVAESGHNLDGWWCSEHGVPEDDCSMCSTEAAAQCKAKGDWCKEHDRADSQCFVCHPELEAKFAARYEAKFGKKPPKPESAGDAHQHTEEKPKS